MTAAQRALVERRVARLWGIWQALGWWRDAAGRERHWAGNLDAYGRLCWAVWAEFDDGEE